jgi:hypothetical protein
MMHRPKSYSRGPCAAVVFGVLLTVGVGVPPRTACATPPDARTVRTMLGAVDDAPGADAWQRLGPETVLVLARIYDDPGQGYAVRVRAVMVAGYFPGAPSGIFLRAVLRGAGQDELVVHHALISLARALGPAAEGDVAPFVGHGSVLVREAAARALDAVGTDGARGIARQRLAVESHPVVRAALARAAVAGGR